MDKLRHRVGVIVCPQASLASIGLALDIFRMANQLPGRHRFDVRRISEDGNPVAHAHGALTVDAGPAQLASMDLVIVPSMWTQGQASAERNPGLVAALKALPHQVLVVSMCSGAFMLAATGRLDGQSVTTHWLLADELQGRYPNLHVQASANLLRQGSLVCSGGSLAGVDACLMAVQCLADHRTARELAGMLVTDLSRGPQTRFMPALGARRHADKDITRLQDWLSRHMEQALSLEQMAECIHVSVRTLQRRFLAATGMTPNQYLQALRIEHGKDLLASERLPVPEVAARVGYQDRVAFGRLFKKLVGMSPAAYRQQQMR